VPLRTVIISLLAKMLQDLPVLRLTISAPPLLALVPQVIDSYIALIRFFTQPYKHASRVMVNHIHETNLLVSLLEIVLAYADSVDPEHEILGLVMELE